MIGPNNYNSVTGNLEKFIQRKCGMGLQGRAWREREPREAREEVMKMRGAKVRGAEPGPWQWEGKGQIPSTQ